MTAKSSKPEKKRKMIDLFEELTTQGFKDASNAFYNLNSKTSAEGKKTS
jgi:hypothetical protein